MRTFGLFVSIILLSFHKGSFAYTPKEGNVTGSLGLFGLKTSFDGSESGAKAPWMGGVGLIANGDVNDKGSLEIAVFHFNKLYARDQDGKHIQEQTQLLHIAMGYRRWFNSYLSGSLAFSSGYSMGEPRIIHSDFSSRQEIPTSARDTVEYGIDVSVQTDLWNKEDLSLILDARYFFDFNKKTSEKADHYGALLAVRFMVQEKESENSPSQ